VALDLPVAAVLAPHPGRCRTTRSWWLLRGEPMDSPETEAADWERSGESRSPGHLRRLVAGPPGPGLRPRSGRSTRFPSSRPGLHRPTLADAKGRARNPERPSDLRRPDLLSQSPRCVPPGLVRPRPVALPARANAWAAERSWPTDRLVVCTPENRV
jgi:hypothetical protein